jgi:type VI secretion system protein ImpK
MSHRPNLRTEYEDGVVRPAPGGRPVRAQPIQAAPAAVTDDGALACQFGQVGVNPIVAAATSLLALSTQIRQSASHPDPHRLKDDLARGIRTFEQSAAGTGSSPHKIIAARYVLCTFLDECAASTPWGSGGIWARDTLLVRLHNETWGGEKVFHLLSRLAQQPNANIDLLELIYLCLALGFEGRYRVLDNGRSQLDTIRERLYQMIRQQRGAPETALSEKWQPAPVAARRWYDLTPLWVFGALCLAGAVAVFVNYRALLSTHSDPVFSVTQAVRLPQPQQPFAATPPPPRLAGFLEAEVAAGLVAVDETAHKSVITIRGDGIFEPGRAQVSERVLPLLDRIGAELKRRPGIVLVSGHTDSQPMRSVRFPSNFHLSEERARVVAQLLARTIGAPRVKAEGKAEFEPVAPNTTPADRAKNRRVEITLLPAGG